MELTHSSISERDEGRNGCIELDWTTFPLSGVMLSTIWKTMKFNGRRRERGADNRVIHFKTTTTLYICVREKGNDIYSLQ